MMRGGPPVQRTRVNHMIRISPIRLINAENEQVGVVDTHEALRMAQEAGLDEGEALSFLFENFDSVIDEDTFAHRLRIFNSEIDARKR